MWHNHSQREQYHSLPTALIIFCLCSYSPYSHSAAEDVFCFDTPGLGQKFNSEDILIENGTA